MNHHLEISGIGTERTISAQWTLDQRVAWLEIRLFWYITKREAHMPRPSWWTSVNKDNYLFGNRTLAIHRMHEPVLTGSTQVSLAIPSHPATGAVGGGCIHWAVELIAAPKQLLVRQHFDVS
jgi:hypothetical protein